MKKIYAQLKSDHRLVKSILRKLERTDESDGKLRLRLLHQLKETLVPHARAEELVLYDRLKEHGGKSGVAMAFEGYEEHAVVDRLIELLDHTQTNDKKWSAELTVARENLEHHIQEEESELFAKAQKAFDPQQAEEMGLDFGNLKATFLRGIKSGHPPAQRELHELV